MSLDPFPLNFQQETGDFGTYVMKKVVIGLFGVQGACLGYRVDGRSIVEGIGNDAGSDSVLVAGGLENE